MKTVIRHLLTTHSIKTLSFLYIYVLTLEQWLLWTNFSYFDSDGNILFLNRVIFPCWTMLALSIMLPCFVIAVLCCNYCFQGTWLDLYRVFIEFYTGIVFITNILCKYIHIDVSIHIWVIVAWVPYWLSA